MARALWKGSIAFGLVNIPVELHTAVRDSRPRFRMLHAEDKSPVRFERVCQRELDARRLDGAALVRPGDVVRVRALLLEPTLQLDHRDDRDRPELLALKLALLYQVHQPGAERHEEGGVSQQQETRVNK